VLSHDEQKAWNEIRHRYAEEAEEPARPVLDLTVRRPRSSKPGGLPAAVVAGSGIAILLVICGAPLAGLAIAVATAPRWLLWRYGPLLDGGVRPPAPPSATRDVPLDGEEPPSSEQSCRRTPRTA
jgi:hypothetical protein